MLREAFASDEEPIARFDREAKSLVALNYPKIGGLCVVEESVAEKALVLEPVEGSTLARRIGAGPILVTDTLAIAKRIADALEAGHEAGVIPSRCEAGERQNQRRRDGQSARLRARRRTT